MFPQLGTEMAKVKLSKEKKESEDFAKEVRRHHHTTTDHHHCHCRHESHHTSPAFVIPPPSHAIISPRTLRHRCQHVSERPHTNATPTSRPLLPPPPLPPSFAHRTNELRL